VKLVEVDGDAEAELIETITWYEERQEGVGRRFALSVAAKVKALPIIKLRPLRGYGDCDAMFVNVGGPWPYRIIVVERGSFIRVVAFAHDRREPGYWLPRASR
jgi:hypothetical protein